MSRTLSGLRVLLLFVPGCLSVLIGASNVGATDFGAEFKTKSVAVDDATVTVTVGGSGPPVVLIHGYAESSRMWKPLARVLAPRFTVLAPDLPGIGASSIPKTGLDMKTSAERVHAAINSMGFKKVRVVGHDIGLMALKRRECHGLHYQSQREDTQRRCR